MFREIRKQCKGFGVYLLIKVGVVLNRWETYLRYFKKSQEIGVSQTFERVSQEGRV